MRRPTLLTVLTALLLLAASPATAIMMLAPVVPTDRLVTNIEAYIKENPDDPQGYYMLARVHYIGFAQQSSKIMANDPGSAEKLPNLADPRAMGHRPEGDDKLDKPALFRHARASILNFQKALEMSPDNALYHLGYAGILEQSRDYAEFIGKLDTLEPIGDDDADEEGNPPDVAMEYLRASQAQYLAAYKAGREETLKTDSVFLPFYPVAYEAGQAYLRLVASHDNLFAENDELVAQIKQDIARIDELPKAITPVILRITGDAPRKLDELLAADTIVNFDLDADGVAERRPWVKADTALLCWDPDNTGKITSGEQLFGNMTFFMLFTDGYRALDTLDDNRDGQLTGDELKGLALWTDANSNGVSDEGEVTPIAQTPIKSLATKMTGKEDHHPLAQHGVTLDDGTTRTTWDWIAPGIKAE